MTERGAGEVKKLEGVTGDGAEADGRDEDRLRLASITSAAAAADDDSTKTDEREEGALQSVEPEEVKSKSPAEDLFSGNPICNHCVLREYAVAYCKDCPNFLCEGCYGYHGTMVSTSGHVVIENPAIESIKSHYYCKDPEHPNKPLDFFCKTCKSPICQECFVTTCRDHEKILEKVIRAEIKDLVDGVKANENAFHEFGVFIDKVMSDSDEAAHRCMHEVNMVFNSMAENLESKREEILSMLKAKKESNVNKNRDQKKKVEGMAEDMGDTISETETLLRTTKTSRIMVNKLVTCARLEEYAMKVWNREAAVYQSWKLQHEPVLKYINKFGHLIPKPRPEDIIIGGLINQRAKVGVTNTFTITINNVSDQLGDFGEEEAKGFVEARIIFVPNGRQGQPEKSTIIRNKVRRENNRWTVSYLIRMGGTVTISLIVCNEMVERQPFTLQATKVELKEGEKVQRGPDWDYPDQDGGGENIQGNVVKHNRPGWVRVRWDGSKTKTSELPDYRFGYDFSYDVEPVPIK